MPQARKRIDLRDDQRTCRRLAAFTKCRTRGYDSERRCRDVLFALGMKPCAFVCLAGRKGPIEWRSYRCSCWGRYIEIIIIVNFWDSSVRLARVAEHARPYKEKSNRLQFETVSRGRIRSSPEAGDSINCGRIDVKTLVHCVIANKKTHDLTNEHLS